MSRVLIVDDDRQLLAAVGQKLTQQGFECRAELTADAALAFLNDHAVDVAVLDVMLPGMSGFELCRRIRKDARLFAVQVLFLSSMASEEEVEHALAQGADDFLSKPFHLEDLVRRVENLMMVGRTHKLTDELTSLPGSKCIKLEMQKRIYDEQPFDIVYAQLLHLNEMASSHGPATRERAIRHFARALLKCGEKLESSVFSVGHMGGGHFVTLLDPGKGKQYAENVTKFWKLYQPNFFASAGLEKAYQMSLERPGAEGAAVITETLLCATRHEVGARESAKDLLDVLSHIHESASEQYRKGIVLDRRAGTATPAIT